MPYAITHDPVHEVVELTFSGLITGDDLREAATTCTGLQKRTGVMKFLVDANGWDVAASLVEIYEIPAEHYWEEEFSLHSRVAVILPKSVSAQEAARFYETVCRNRGWNVRVCPDRQNALDWLSTGIFKSSDARG